MGELKPIADEGLDGFFFDSPESIVVEAIAGLDLIGASKTVELARRTHDVCKAERLRLERVGDAAYRDADRDHYFDQIDTLDKALDRLVLGESAPENLGRLRMLYARAHALEFVEE